MQQLKEFSRKDIEKLYAQANSLRRYDLVNETPSLQELLLYMDVTISRELRTFSIFAICGSERSRFQVSPYFISAFKSLTLSEQIQLFLRTIKYAIDHQSHQRHLVQVFQNYTPQATAKQTEQVRKNQNQGKQPAQSKGRESAQNKGKQPAQSRGKLYEQNQIKTNTLNQRPSSPEDKGQDRSQRKKELPQLRLDALGNEPTAVSISPAIDFGVVFKTGFRSWREAYMKLMGTKAISPPGIQIDLVNYLIRTSKNKEKECFVLEAVEKSEPTTIRFAFLQQKDQERVVPQLVRVVSWAHYERVGKMCPHLDSQYQSNSNNTLITLNSPLKKSSRHSQDKESSLKENIPLEMAMNQPRKEEHSLARTLRESTVVEEMLKESALQDIRQSLEVLEEVGSKVVSKESFKKNVFEVIMPVYDIDSLNSLSGFLEVDVQEDWGLWEKEADRRILRGRWTMKGSIEDVAKVLADIATMHRWHPEIVQGQFKMDISSENSVIGYWKCKALSGLYREREFLFIRHVFKCNSRIYVVDKSIENINFLPIPTLQRGNIDYQICMLESGFDSQTTKITLEAKMQHAGLLNPRQERELTLRFLKGYFKLQSMAIPTSIIPFDLDWVVTLTTPHMSRSVTLGSQYFAESRSDTNESYYSMEDVEDHESPMKNSQMPERHEIQTPHKTSEEADVERSEIIEKIAVDTSNRGRSRPGDQSARELLQVNQEGLVILPKKYLKYRSPQEPINVEYRRVRKLYADFIARDIWEHDNEGYFVLTNEAKIKAQDNVIKFILSNMFSGKGVLNVSLPVTIFNSDSNLERICWCLTMAPQFCEQATKCPDPKDRFKQLVAFAISDSLLYVDVEKPFNPILGETYQGFIGGCPVYAQQISHHPPIGAVYMVGRGYTIHATIESKVEISLNSGKGINNGWHHVEMPGTHFMFQTPPGEFTGFAMGSRKYMMSGKGYYLDTVNQLYCEMNFEDQSGFFAKKKWTSRDQLQGRLLKVNGEFLTSLLASKHGSRPILKQSDIEEEYGRFHGRWSTKVYFQTELLYDVNEQLPFELQDELTPLNSNATYREDVYYRRIEDSSRSQIEKDRLENIQRRDRKLRAELGPKGHH